MQPSVILPRIYTLATCWVLIKLREVKKNLWITSNGMVLESKSISYGTLDDIAQNPPPPTHSAFLHVTQLISQAADTSLNLRRTPSSEMTQDLYQRQPLLSSKNEGWDDCSSSEPSTLYESRGSSNGSRSSGSVTINGLNKSITSNGSCSSSSSNNGTKPENGIIRIDVPAPHRDEPKFPREYFKTLIAFLFCLFNWFLTTISLALVHERVPDRTHYGPLPDVFLDNVPAADWALDVSEILIIISTTSCMILLFFHKYRSIVMRRVFFLLGVLYMMRAFTMYATVMPVASRTYYCSPKSNHTGAAVITLRAIRILVGMGLSINGQHVYCGDYIYSGHTVILTVSSLLIQEYTPRKWRPLHWLSWLVTCLGVVFVMVAHGHYTVDVLIAYYVTTRVFWMYHTMASNTILKQNGPSNYLSKLWWYCIFTYFERNVGGVVPRRYEWPLPWPRHFLSKYPDRNS
ncbi:phosphatidylcholine:ceramide cholinephosphotransferase 2-like isoform X2 [Daphnia pulicaria]|uniref:phosphatidylcholine:ceramide cholinephosphotransferase 2-like isoform X2 n=1 Tax=Daphnia pulicaria TaxID=35523 RepID=UPI001EEC4B84|nr:phosphatidylcholine:ceramide cholinephosphotransferase 2-like isoform X2 [Daphnia pulicaria]